MNKPTQLNVKFAAPDKLIFHIITLEFDESDILSLLPILEELVIEFAPLHIEQSCLNKLTTNIE